MRKSNFRMGCWVASCMFALAITGCDGLRSNSVARSQQQNGIAVIDLDEVARQLGRDVQMIEEVDEHRQSLNEHLATVKQLLEEEIAKRQSSAENELSEEQVQQALLAMQQQANLKLNQVQQQAIASTNQHRALLIRTFREETRAAAKEVANESGIKLIVTNNDTVVFSFEETNDITDQVVERMRRKAATTQVASQERVASVSTENEVR